MIVLLAAGWVLRADLYAATLAVWTQLTNTGSEATIALASNQQNPPRLYAGTDANGLYVSTNGGSSWSNPLAEPIASAATGSFTPTVAFAGTANGGFWRTANGTTWNEASDGLTASWVTTIRPTSPITLYLGTDDGVYVSSDGSNSWMPASTGMPDNALVLALEQDGSAIVAGTADVGAYRSLDGGESWEDGSNGLGAGAVNDLVKAGRVLHAGTGDGVYSSIDQAENWTDTSSGLGNTNVLALAASRRVPRVLIAGTPTGVFVSGNHGVSWQAAFTALPAGDNYVNRVNTTGQPIEMVLTGTNTGVWKLSQISDLGCAAVPDAGFAAPATDLTAADIGFVAATWYGALNLVTDLNEDDRNDIIDIMLSSSIFGTTCPP
jgi:hypothetical protein